MNKRLAFISYLALVLILAFHAVSSVSAQTPPPPQKVTAVYNGLIPATWDPECVTIPAKFTVEVWNVGSAGGGIYGDATITSEGPVCQIDSQGNVTPGNNETGTFHGTFSGGPDGVVIFTDPDQPQLDERVLFIDGTIARITISDGVNTMYVDLQVINPDAFEGNEPPPTAEPTPGSACEPVISNITGLKPGDILSPAVDFIGPDGQPVGALSSVWYINGAQANSVTWDGKETSLILQYTCPDHSAYEKRVTIPAYTPGNIPAITPQVPMGPNISQPNPNGLLKTGVMAGGLVAGVIGAVGVVIAGGYVAANLLSPKPVPAARPPAQPAPQAPSRQAASPLAPVQLQPEQPPPSHRKLSMEDRIKLEEIRSQMDGQISENTTRFNNLGDERQRLLNFFRKNALKFVGKKALETVQTLTITPAEAVAQGALDPVMKKLFGTHDTSDDANIILRIHSALNENGGQMRELRREVIHLRNEIDQINQRLKG